MSETITLEEPTELRKREIEERLEKVALDGLVNIHRAITGKTCERYVSLGMATSAVSALKARCTELEAALRGQAVNLLKMRDALVVGDAQEAYHWLYLIADNGRDSLTPWDELEARAVLEQQTDNLQGG